MPGIDIHTKVLAKFNRTAGVKTIIPDIGRVYTVGPAANIQHSATGPRQGQSFEITTAGSFIYDLPAINIFKPFTVSSWVREDNALQDGDELAFVKQTLPVADGNITRKVITIGFRRTGGNLKGFYRLETFAGGVSVATTTLDTSGSVNWETTANPPKHLAIGWEPRENNILIITFYMDGTAAGSLVDIAGVPVDIVSQYNTDGFITGFNPQDENRTFTILIGTRVTVGRKYYLDEFMVSDINRYTKLASSFTGTFVTPQDSTSSDLLSSDINDNDPAQLSSFRQAVDFESLPITELSAGNVVTNTGGTSINTNEFAKGIAAGSFDGVDDFLTIADPATKFDLNRHQFYFSCWIYITELPTQVGRIKGILEYLTDANNYLSLGILRTGASTNKLYLELKTSTIALISLTGDENLQLNKWYKIEIVGRREEQRNYNGRSANVRYTLIYLNGTVDTVLENFGYNVAVNPVTTGLNIGRTRFPGVTNELFKGLIDSVRVDYGDNTIRIIHSHHVNRWSENHIDTVLLFDPVKTPISPLIDPSVFPSNIPSFTLGANQIYVAGIDPMLKIKGTAIYPIGLTKPNSITPTVYAPANTAVDPNGSWGSNALQYSYVYTFVDSEGNESQPSDAVATVGGISPPNGTEAVRLELNFTDAFIPPSATKVRLYRKSSSDTNHKFFKEVNLPIDDVSAAGTVYLNTVIDRNIDPESPLTIPPPANLLTVPTSNHVANHKFRNYYGFQEQFPSRVMFSEINQLDIAYTTSYFFVGSDDSEVITGMISFKSNLLIWKERSMYRTIGDPGTADFQVEYLNGVGCVSHQSIARNEDVVVWMAEEGIYAYNGGFDPILISNDIEPLIEEIKSSRKVRIAAAIDLQRGLYILTISKDDSSTNNKLLVYNIREALSQRTDTQYRVPGSTAFSTWDISGIDALAGGFTEDEREPLVFFVTNIEFGYFDGEPEGINFEFKGGNINVSEEDMAQHVFYMTFVVSPSTSDLKSYTVGYEIDGVETTAPINLNGETVLKLMVRRRTMYIKPILRGTNIAEDLKVIGISLATRDIGRH